MTRQMTAAMLQAAVPRSLQSLQQRMSASVDPLGVMTPIWHAQLAWALHPVELAERSLQLSYTIYSVYQHSWRRALGQPSVDPVAPQPDDTRFVDPAWTDHASWDILKQWYLLWTRHIQDMLFDTPGLSEKERSRAAFWWRKLLNALAPTNYLLTNPVAMRQAMETGGDSLRRGWANLVADLAAGDMRLADPTDFKVGENLATTPGFVVLRNRLLELIHYQPTVSKVRSIPIVIVTPWINKFYVLDLTPKKSLVKFLLDQGYDVYITSWKNPDESMRDVSFDDYVIQGVDEAINTARDISQAAQVHAVGYCIGGTALSMYMAWANRAYPADKQPVAHWTLLTTLTDFSRPGDIEVFIDEGSINYLCNAMETTGYLDGRQMAASFRLLRSNSLIWHYFVHGYLYGEKPPAFDVLYWNMDSTRMPARMHGWYLRELYLRNLLIEPDALFVAGQKLNLGCIHQPLYAVGAEDDHIAPWRQAFRTINFVRGPKRFALSSSGHILGIVNPPVDPPKRSFRAGTAHRSDSPVAWMDRYERQVGSWWSDWLAWLEPQMGELRELVPMSSHKHPRLGRAPGTYVLEH